MPRPRLLPDPTPFRDSRDLRLVVGGDISSGMGAQAALVALPYQRYVVTHSGGSGMPGGSGATSSPGTVAGAGGPRLWIELDETQHTVALN